MQDELLVNKIAAAVLTAALIAMTAGFIASFIYHPTELAQDAYVIEVEESGTATAAAEEPAGPEPIAALLAAASVDDGQSVAKKRCGSCHKFEKDGKDGVGPALWNVVNADKGARAGFKYSSAMAGFDGSWGYEELNQFIYKPNDYLPGTKMKFKGLKKTGDRANLIAYLRSLSDSPAPLPE